MLNERMSGEPAGRSCEQEEARRQLEHLEAPRERASESGTHVEDALGRDLDHGLLERLGRQDVVLGLADEAARLAECKLADRLREGRLARHLERERLLERGRLGPVGAEHVGGEAGDVRRGHPARARGRGG